MGISIALVDSKSDVIDRVDDEKNFLHKLLPPVDEDSQSLLAKIDWYGDTYFNYLQMKGFLREWDGMTARAKTREERDLVNAVRELALRCQRDQEVLRFIGD